MSVQCTDIALDALNKGDVNKFLSLLKNDLTKSAVSLVPEISDNINALEQVGGVALMTGSGSCTFGIFTDKKARDNAYKQLKPIYKSNLIKAQTILP